MNRLTLRVLMASAALLVASLQSAHADAQTAPAQPAPDSGASMVKPPSEASGGSNNPDNMPVKKPRMPTNDKMMRTPPASAANAK
ncbi:MAG TPA: hypothetical protein VNE00_12695 [Paraburkholderia sp.]|jgi:hypothetical protein|nr:hypothetical protein [Paraburkholderia sp.]